jgi:hypothetical protein
MNKATCVISTLLFVAYLGACSSGGSSNSKDADGGVGGGVGAAGGGTGGSAESAGGSGKSDPPLTNDDQTEACKKYVDCAAAASAATLGPILDAYAPNGSCWGQGVELATTCNAACIEGTEELSYYYPKESACWECTTDAQCLPESCSPATHKCGNAGEDLSNTTICSDALLTELLGEEDDTYSCMLERCGTAFETCFGATGPCSYMSVCATACMMGSQCDTSCFRDCLSTDPQEACDQCFEDEGLRACAESSCLP